MKFIPNEIIGYFQRRNLVFKISSETAPRSKRLEWTNRLFQHECLLSSMNKSANEITCKPYDESHIYWNNSFLINEIVKISDIIQFSKWILLFDSSHLTEFRWTWIDTIIQFYKWIKESGYHLCFGLVRL